MKILHVWCIADVSLTLAKEFAKLGHKSYVLMDAKQDLQTYRFGENNKEIVHLTWLRPNQPYLLLFRVLLEVERFKPDIVQLHQFHALSKQIKRLSKKTKIISHLHGSEIRNNWESSDILDYKNFIDKFVVVTPDLLEGAIDGVKHIPNPLNEDLFFNNGKIGKKGLFIKLNNRDDLAFAKAQQFAQERNIELEIFDRTKGFIFYSNFADYLRNYGFYFDIKTHNNPKQEEYILNANSVSGLQALNCGLQVINWDGKIVPKSILEKHRISNIIPQWIDLYREVMQ